MSAAPTPKLTPAQYLAIERKAAFKSEYFNGEMFAMAGASYPHNRVKDNLARHAGNQLNGGPCVVVTSDMRLKVSVTGLYTYPDVVIVCAPPEFEDDRQDVLLNPQVVIEVLSDSTESYDRGAKFRHYQQVASLREYVLVAQNVPVCDRFVRQSDDNWLLTTVSGLGAELALATVPVRVSLAAVYAGVTFPENPGR
jgi:Uma2 family endonuclease